jgi:hypothetical protein
LALHQRQVLKGRLPFCQFISLTPVCLQITNVQSVPPTKKKEEAIEDILALYSNKQVSLSINSHELLWDSRHVRIIFSHHDSHVEWLFASQHTCTYSFACLRIWFFLIRQLAPSTSTALPPPCISTSGCIRR